MTTAAYNTWVRGGRKYTVAQPISEVVAYAKAAGVQWLGTLGSDDERHLKASRPQDHTPFSVTAWPLPLPGYVVTACDLVRGSWCDRFLAECRAGLHPWVKYINFGGHQYSVKTGWRQESSSDEHFHVSARTDFLNAHARNPFVATVIEEYEEMAGFARGQDGQLYYVTGMESRPIADADMPAIIQTSQQGLSPALTNVGKVKAANMYDAREWEGEWIRKGWGPNWAGPVRETPEVGGNLSVGVVEEAVRNVLRSV